MPLYDEFSQEVETEGARYLLEEVQRLRSINSPIPPKWEKWAREYEANNKSIEHLVSWSPRIGGKA